MLSVSFTALSAKFTVSLSVMSIESSVKMYLIFLERPLDFK